MSDEDDLFADSPELSGPQVETAKPRQRLIDGPLRHAYLLKRDPFRLRCAAVLAPCGICRQPIDYGRRHPHPEAWECDHILSVDARPDLALEVSNFQASHSICNRRKGLLEGVSGTIVDDGSAVGSGGVVDEWDESSWPTAVVNGQLIRYKHDLGIPTEIW